MEGYVFEKYKLPYIGNYIAKSMGMWSFTSNNPNMTLDIMRMLVRRTCNVAITNVTASVVDNTTTHVFSAPEIIRHVAIIINMMNRVELYKRSEMHECDSP
jgi:hypothetical protein